MIEKELVYTRGVPQRFWLTETGKEVARAILAGEIRLLVFRRAAAGTARHRDPVLAPRRGYLPG